MMKMMAMARHKSTRLCLAATASPDFNAMKCGRDHQNGLVGTTIAMATGDGVGKMKMSMGQR